MIQLPDFNDPFSYENGFYLTCESNRVGKCIAHYELYKRSLSVPGALVECGVFKGASFARFAAFRKLLNGSKDQKMIGFDMFGPFPETNFKEDQKHRENFVQAAGLESIGTDQLMRVLQHKDCAGNVELVAGNICQTIPDYLKQNPDLKISILNLDTDIYEPAVTILENLFPRIEPGGVLILDDYDVFPGETKAVDDYFAGQDVQIEKFPYSATPCFIIKK